MEELTAEQIAAYRNDLRRGGKAARQAFKTLSEHWAAWMQASAPSKADNLLQRLPHELTSFVGDFLGLFLTEPALIRRQLEATLHTMWERRGATDPGMPYIEWLCALASAGLFPQHGPDATTPDEQLMALTKYVRSDPAYSLLYGKHAGPAYGRCCQWGAPPEMAQEVVQQAFLRTWLSRYTYRDGAPFAPFFYTVLWHAFLKASIDAARHRLPAPPAGLLLADQVFAPLVTSGPEDHILFAELRQHLSRCVSSLPATERVVVELRLQDRLYREIATTLNIPEGTGKRHMHNALRKIRECLRTALEDE